MNYLELMVSAELFLLVFIPNFETQITSKYMGDFFRHGEGWV